MLFYFLLIINFVGFIIMGIDKNKARKKKWRIPEKVLWFFAFCGGVLGIYLGMYFFHHKTQHAKFVYGLPVIFLGQLSVIVFLARKL